MENREQHSIVICNEWDLTCDSLLIRYQPPDDNEDYSIPSDAILDEKVKQPQTQE